MTQNNTQKATGTLRNDQNRLIFEQGFSFSGYERDALFLNREGKKFTDISGVSGIDSITDGRAAVFADFDNDGDEDVFLTTVQGPGHLLFRNNVGQDNHWVRMVLEGAAETGRDAYGSVVRVKTSAGTLTKVKAGGSGFLSQGDPRLLFGLGRDTAPQSIEVTWSNGRVESFTFPPRADTTFLLRYGAGKAQELHLSATRLPDPLTKAQALERGLKVRIGEPLPDLKVKTLSGRVQSLRSMLKPGHRTIVNLWATWCTLCRTEMPELDHMQKRFAAQGVDLIGLNLDTDPSKLAPFLKKVPVQYAIVVGGEPAIERLFAGDDMALPLSIVLNERGEIEQLISGWSPETKQFFEALASGKNANSD